jgi:hypothetical protein
MLRRVSPSLDRNRPAFGSSGSGAVPVMLAVRDMQCPR